MQAAKVFVRLVPFLALIAAQAANGYENRCHERSTGAAQSVCQGRMIPANKARNIHRQAQTLVCSSNVDHYIRSQQKFDFAKWNDLLKADQSVEAQNLRKEQQDIKWAGRIPYQTVEKWTWESCDLVTSSFHCGTHTEYRKVQRSRQRCTGAGKNQSCRTEYYTETVSEQVANTCWADIEQNESWPCSNEVMTFSAQFSRPDYNQWKPGTKGYMDALPNKYDLLPGEVEDVQIFTSSSVSRVVNPAVEVADAWNSYKFAMGGSAVGATCRQNDNLDLIVQISTVGRNSDKKTPNAFKMPRNVRGEPVPAIKWAIKPSINGQQIIEGEPEALLLADTSSGIINSIAEQSQKIAEREAAKQQQGQGKTTDAMSPNDQVKAGFFKNTKVRVQIVKKNNYLFDTKATRDMILDQGEGIAPSINFLSENQEIAYSDLWEIQLRGKENHGAFASTFLGRNRHLRPGQKYVFEVSMYQKGAKGLYLQDCDEAPSFWSCKFRWMGLGRTDTNIFSNPIAIDFNLDENVVDERGYFDTFMDFLK